MYKYGFSKTLKGYLVNVKGEPRELYKNSNRNKFPNIISHIILTIFKFKVAGPTFPVASLLSASCFKQMANLSSTGGRDLGSKYTTFYMTWDKQFTLLGLYPSSIKLRGWKYMPLTIIM